MNVAGTLRRARQHAGLSQTQLAHLANMPQSTIGRIEAGLAVPRIGTWARLLALCGWRVDAVAPAGPSVVSVADRDPDSVPYFMWDSDMTWARFEAALRDSDADVRGWAFGRLLSEARWADVWTLVTVDEVRANLPLAHFKSKPRWERLLASLVAA